MRQVDRPDVPVAADPEIVNVERFGLEAAALLAHGAHVLGADEEAVGVVLDARVIEVAVVAQLDRVTQETVAQFRQEVLHVDVANEDLLPPVGVAVEPAVGVLLELVEPREVGLDPVREVVALQPHTEVVVGIKKPAEIAREVLDPGDEREEVVVRAHVGEVILNETFLQPDVTVHAVRALARVNVDDVALERVEVVDLRDGRQADRPILGLERRVSLEDLDRGHEVLDEEELIGLAEKALAIGALRADSAGEGERPSLGQCVTLGLEQHEDVVAQDRIVALEDVLRVRIEQAAQGRVEARRAGLVGRLARRSVVALPLGKLDAPAILERKEPPLAIGGKAGVGARRSRLGRGRGRRSRRGDRSLRGSRRRHDGRRPGTRRSRAARRAGVGRGLGRRLRLGRRLLLVGRRRPGTRRSRAAVLRAGRERGDERERQPEHGYAQEPPRPRPHLRLPPEARRRSRSRGQDPFEAHSP